MVMESTEALKLITPVHHGLDTTALAKQVGSLHSRHPSLLSFQV